MKRTVEQRINALYAHIAACCRLPAGCFKFRRTLAVALKAVFGRVPSVRTVARYLAALVGRGLVEIKRRPNKSSIYTLVVTSCSNQQMVLDFSAPLSSPLSSPILRSESTPERERQECTGRVPLATPAPLSPLSTPKENLPTRIVRLLERAAYRIFRARNPEAYRQAIIRSEMRVEALGPDPYLEWRATQNRVTLPDESHKLSRERQHAADLNALRSFFGRTDIVRSL